MTVHIVRNSVSPPRATSVCPSTNGTSYCFSMEGDNVMFFLSVVRDGRMHLVDHVGTFGWSRYEVYLDGKSFILFKVVYYNGENES